MPSLYARYIEEREGKHIVESDKGFATYSFHPDETCYITDIYVLPDFRQDGVASELANKIVEVAKEKGCKTLVGSVCPRAKGSTTSLKVLLGYGFDLWYSTGEMIFFRKDI